jgi:CBS domain-containing protein
MLCRDVMRKKVLVCHATDPVYECARIMRDGNVGFLPVVDAQGMVNGLVTDRDLTVRVLAENLSLSMPVSAVMTRDVRICRATDPLRTAERRMAEIKRSRLVVVDEEGRCVGVISISDIARADSRAQAGHVLYAISQRQTAGAARGPIKTPL